MHIGERLAGRVRAWSFQHFQQPKFRAGGDLFSQPMRTFLHIVLRQHSNSATVEDIVQAFMGAFPGRYRDRDSCYHSVAPLLQKEELAGAIIRQNGRILRKQKGGIGIASDTVYGIGLGLLIVAWVFNLRLDGADVSFYSLSAGIITMVSKVFYDAFRIIKLRT